MDGYISRNSYLQKIVDRRDNGDIKVITGPRRCGKSWLLKRIYKDYLLSQGVPEANIIIVSFDIDDESNQSSLTEKEALKAYLYGRMTSETDRYYVFLDEVQEVDGFEKIVNGLNERPNVDVYVTGSNSKLLSSDINTIFRGRGDEVRVWPFSFKEFCQQREEDKFTLWREYYTYGGLPALRQRKDPRQKALYLRRLWDKTYISDVVERHGVRNVEALNALVDVLSSSIGSLTNPNRVKNSLQSIKKTKIDEETVSKYIGYLEEAFLFEGSQRYNIKGRQYYDSIKKYYTVDVGLRNARLNFRQQEVTHLMENIIYNELRSRDYLVDVGVVESREMRNGKQKYIQYEVDFIATDGMNKIYIQSAFRIPDEDKREQELKSLKKIDDSFRKVIVVGDDIEPYTDDNGFNYVGIYDFLLSENLF